MGFIKAMYTSMRWCNWVEPTEGATGEDKGVLFFRNRNGLGVPPQKLKPNSWKKATMVVGADSDVETS
jgi:omega-6 fatty acid desaturase (delta-12 desaturase)